MYEYNRALKSASLRQLKTSVVTASIFDDSVTVGYEAGKSSSGKSCWCCKAEVDIEWRYCIVCGNAINLDLINTIRPISPIVHVTSKKAIDQSREKPVEKVELALPKEILMALDRYIDSSSTNGIDYKQSISKIKRLTLFYEIENATIMEDAYQSIKDERSVRYNSNSNSNSTLQSVYTNNSMVTDSASAVGAGYLDDVGSVTALYERYMNTEELLKGLTSASIEPLVIDKIEERNDADAWYWKDESDRFKVNEPSDLDEDISRPTSSNAHFMPDCEENLSKEIAVLWTETLEYCRDKEKEHREILKELENERVNALINGFSPKKDDEASMGSALDEKSQGDSFSIISEGTMDEGVNVGSGAVKEYACIARIYRRSTKRINSLINQCYSDFIKDPLHLKSKLFIQSEKSINELNIAVTEAHECDEDSKKYYLKFKAQAGQTRADIATKVSDVLESIANIHSNYNIKYMEALNSFEQKRKLTQLYDSVTGPAVTSDEEMDSIKRDAEKDLHKYGLALKKVQGAEADIALKLKNDEYAMVETIKKWRPQHSRSIYYAHKSIQRLTELNRETAARFIQRNVRQLFLIWLRIEVYDEWNQEYERRRIRREGLEQRKKEAIERNIKFATTKRPISTTVTLPKLTGRRFQKERSMLVQKLS